MIHWSMESDSDSHLVRIFFSLFLRYHPLSLSAWSWTGWSLQTARQSGDCERTEKWGSGKSSAQTSVKNSNEQIIRHKLFAQHIWISFSEWLNYVCHVAVASSWQSCAKCKVTIYFWRIRWMQMRSNRRESGTVIVSISAENHHCNCKWEQTMDMVWFTKCHLYIESYKSRGTECISGSRSSFVRNLFIWIFDDGKSALNKYLFAVCIATHHSSHLACSALRWMTEKSHATECSNESSDFFLGWRRIREKKRIDWRVAYDFKRWDIIWWLLSSVNREKKIRKFVLLKSIWLSVVSTTAEIEPIYTTRQWRVQKEWNKPIAEKTMRLAALSITYSLSLALALPHTRTHLVWHKLNAIVKWWKQFSSRLIRLCAERRMHAFVRPKHYEQMWRRLRAMVDCFAKPIPFGQRNNFVNFVVTGNSMWSPIDKTQS